MGVGLPALRGSGLSGYDNIADVRRHWQIVRMTIKERLLRHPLLIAIALSIGYGIASLDRLLFSQALGRPLEINEPVVFVVDGLLTALPFLALSLAGKQHVTPWIVGLSTSIWLTWWWLQKGIAYQRAPDGSGVDMGGALIMLLAPFLITAVCLLLNRQLGGPKANGS